MSNDKQCAFLGIPANGAPLSQDFSAATYSVVTLCKMVTEECGVSQDSQVDSNNVPLTASNIRPSQAIYYNMKSPQLILRIPLAPTTRLMVLLFSPTRSSSVLMGGLYLQRVVILHLTKTPSLLLLSTEVSDTSCSAMLPYSTRNTQ
jgi:hypothetical protein